MTSDKLPHIVSRHPELLPIAEAIRQYFAGEPLGVPCPKCGSLLRVEAIKAVDTVWVICPNGHIRYHENYVRGYLDKKLPPDKPTR